MRVKIVDLKPISTTHLDPEKVNRFAKLADSLPPVIVFKTPDGMILADGYHRVAAARSREEQEVEAEVIIGSRGDALRRAAEIGAQQHGISVAEALKRIHLHSGKLDEKDSKRHSR